MRLVRAHREATKRVANLERRVLALLTSEVADDDTALHETTLAALHEALSQLLLDASVSYVMALAMHERNGRMIEGADAT